MFQVKLFCFSIYETSILKKQSSPCRLVKLGKLELLKKASYLLLKARNVNLK